MRAFAGALLLLAAASAGAGELIRFRAADGSLGLVDHASKLPPGAIVLERSEKRVADPRRLPAAPFPEAEAVDWPAQQAKRRSSRCAHYGLPRDCDPGLIASADSWCDRGHGARAALERAGERVAEEEEDYEDCRTASGVMPYCSRHALDAAEAAAEGAEQALQSLEDACRAAGCLPGWVRGGCEP